MKCDLCPRGCNVDRDNAVGFCGVGNEIIVANIGIHRWEEPIIGGEGGSGAVFFCGCNLKCVYCQNFEISHPYMGSLCRECNESACEDKRAVSASSNCNKNAAANRFGFKIKPEELAERLIEMQESGAACIDFVTPTHYSHIIPSVVTLARKRGLTLPIVCNCGGYERVETLKMLEDFVDVYLPDFKYSDAALAKRLSGAEDYPKAALKAIAEMKRQKSDVLENGLMKMGVLIRHLVIPSLLGNSRGVLDAIRENFGVDTYVSLMSQYFPPEKPLTEQFLCRRLTKREKQRIEDYFFSLGFTNGFVQELCSADKKYVPVWE